MRLAVLRAAAQAGRQPAAVKRMMQLHSSRGFSDAAVMSQVKSRGFSTATVVDAAAKGDAKISPSPCTDLVTLRHVPTPIRFEEYKVVNSHGGGVYPKIVAPYMVEGVTGRFASAKRGGDVKVAGEDTKGVAGEDTMVPGGNKDVVKVPGGNNLDVAGEDAKGPADVAKELLVRDVEGARWRNKKDMIASAGKELRVAVVAVVKKLLMAILDASKSVHLAFVSSLKRVGVAVVAGGKSISMAVFGSVQKLGFSIVAAVERVYLAVMGAIRKVGIVVRAAGNRLVMFGDGAGAPPPPPPPPTPTPPRHNGFDEGAGTGAADAAGTGQVLKAIEGLGIKIMGHIDEKVNLNRIWWLNNMEEIRAKIDRRSFMQNGFLSLCKLAAVAWFSLAHGAKIMCEAVKEIAKSFQGDDEFKKSVNYILDHSYDHVMGRLGASTWQMFRGILMKLFKSSPETKAAAIRMGEVARLELRKNPFDDHRFDN